MTLDALHECRGLKILVMEPFFYTPHVETGFEISKILSTSNDLTYVGPDALNCLTEEVYRFSNRQLIRYSRKRHVSDYLTSSTRKLTKSEISALAASPDLAELSRIIDLLDPSFESAMYGSFDLGMGIKSALLWLTRDIAVSPNRHLKFSLALARDAIRIYRLTERLIRDDRFDMVVLFNGRLAPVRAIRRACEAVGTRYLVHERGSSFRKYAIFDCATPHQPMGYRSWVDTWWQVADDPMRNAQDFLDKRRGGIPTSWYSFTGKQVKGDIPPKSSRRRIAFFTSSEDELAAIGDELRADTPFCDQVAAMRSLGAACRARGDEFVVRFHPNTSKSATSLMRAAKDAAEIVCEPLSAVDSYALAESSDVVFTQNSTMGIEAAAVGRPVYYTGRNIFEACRSVRRIKSDSDLSAALHRSAPPDKLDALKYANFFGTHGIEYKYYSPRDISSGTYLGKDLNAPLAALRDWKLRLRSGGV